MKRLLPLLALPVAACALWSSDPAVNPDPNHIHADFAVWVNGTKLDFSDARYMSEPPAETASFFVPTASAHGDEEDGHVVPGREYLHLHDGVGNVIHRHKPGLTIGNFFSSIGMPMTSACLRLDNFQFEKLDPGWVESFARTQNLCDGGKFRWTMIVNGTEGPLNPEYVINDLDKILLSYSASDTMAMEEYARMTDDACLYSQTCPERGAPPAESCIADPTVPCVQP